MSITVLGSCRVNRIPDRNNLNVDINYAHSTKEALQLVKFVMGKLDIPSPYSRYCFRTGIIERRDIHISPSMKTMLEASDIVVMEVCSRKKYMYGDFYLHHLSVDKRHPGDWHAATPQWILDGYTTVVQTDDEIAADILEMQTLLTGKTLVIVSHYNAKHNGEYLESRQSLIKLLGKICEAYDIVFVNPTDVLAGCTQEQVMTADLGHYTDYGLQLMAAYMKQLIENLKADI